MIRLFKISVVIAFLLPIFSFSQVDIWEEFNQLLEKDNLKVRQVRKGLKALNSAKQISLEQDYYSFRNSWNELYPKYETHSLYFLKVIDSVKEKYYNLKLFSYRGKVIYVTLINWEDSILEKKIIRKQYYDMITLHNEKMKIKADTSHLFFNPLYEVVFNYGSECEGSNYLKFVSKLVKDSNRKDLMKLCHSLCPEIRMYGVYGFLWMAERGMELTTEEKRLMKLICNEETLILYCDSCEGNSLISIKEYVDEVFDDYPEYLYSN